MEVHFPEIALKQPKVDPRTVLFNKRQFLESSSDHIPEGRNNKQAHKTRSATTSALEATKCDRFMCATSATSRLESQISVLATSPTFIVNSEEISSASASAAASTASLASASASSCSPSTSSIHSTTLVNNSQSCHLQKNSSLNCRFNDSLNNLYNFQKTKFLFVLIFIYCAISLSSLLPTTQAIPVRRTTASGQRLILHSNVYRERYHPDQRQHQQHSQTRHPNYSHHQLQKYHQQQQQQLQQKPQVQRSTYIAPILRRAQQHYRQQQQQHLQHRHHLHQRAAPVAVAANQHKMSYCENNKFFMNLSLQVNATLQFIRTLCDKYLRSRGATTYDEMMETWKLFKLEIRNPSRKAVSFNNELHRKIHDFFLNLHNFYQLAEFVYQDTTDNKTSIEHGEEIEISVILSLFDTLKNQIKFNMNEAENVLHGLDIEKPDLNDNTVEFNRTIQRKTRDFLIVKEFIEEAEQMAEVINRLCNDQGYSNGNDQ